MKETTRQVAQGCAGSVVAQAFSRLLIEFLGLGQKEESV